MDLSEDELVAAIARVVSAPSMGVRVGIGDDAAIASVRMGELALTADILVEGVHFERAIIAPRDLGYKAIAVNLSDVAAVAASPRYALVSLAIPVDVDAAWVIELYGGMTEACAEHAVSIVGGDLSSGPQVVLSVAIAGEAPAGRAILRSGASPEERIAVTGSLGGSAGGLLLARSRKEMLSEALTAGWGRELLRAHERPQARVAEGQTLAQAGATAMMDLSDGLARDLPRLCRASGVGATISSRSVPVASAVRRLAERFDVDALELALSGGEDYELLVTIPGGAVADARTRLHERFGVPLTDIGATETGDGVRIETDGDVRPLIASGWDHFRHG
jgi:thiamine-monophosphate kinase